MTSDADSASRPQQQAPWQDWAITSNADVEWNTHIPDGPLHLRPVAELRREEKL
jgi:hypothetical protein